jgi:hypothetical protein
LRRPTFAVRIAIIVALAAAVIGTIVSSALSAQGVSGTVHLDGSELSQGSFRFELGASYPALLAIILTAALMAAVSSALKARRRSLGTD